MKVGTGSSSHDFDGDFTITALISSSLAVAGSNTERGCKLASKATDE